jgi:Na+/phosphate symporter
MLTCSVLLAQQKQRRRCAVFSGEFCLHFCVQSSSATTVTTIGLATFLLGSDLVFGANVGTTVLVG